jgi:hypothetical protein
MLMTINRRDINTWVEGIPEDCETGFKVDVDAVPRGAGFLLIKQRCGPFPSSPDVSCLQPKALCEADVVEAVTRVAASVSASALGIVAWARRPQTKTSMAWWSHWTGTTCNRALELKLQSCLSLLSGVG